MIFNVTSVAEQKLSSGFSAAGLALADRERHGRLAGEFAVLEV